MLHERTYIVISGPYSNRWLVETNSIIQAHLLLQEYVAYGWNEAFITSTQDAIEINLNKSDIEKLLELADIW
jgi:hypothetical protein